jgi:tetratricopeptide (TPR) repeat protein
MKIESHSQHNCVSNQTSEERYSQTASNGFILQTIWAESIDAELEGDISLALDIHEQILPVVGKSYAAYLRAGWLHYQAGGYRKSLEFYELAAGCSPGDIAPLFGAMDCYVAMGDSFHASERIKKILDLEAMGNPFLKYPEMQLIRSGAA